ncbi:hypothetical protein D3C79_1095890 [compost metagenome]
MLYGAILLADEFLRLCRGDPLLLAIGFRHQFLPEVVIKREIEQRAVHIQQDGIDVLPGDIKMHGGKLQPEETCATG